ncbi:extracellular solute-binding protein [Alkaliphilus peptidifermentans]|uniref:Iron(III) transport system substrate-binding protein n=1 Tax=Alkaliphilus peptidifermentans DSM 18978 TaxID=1120976 RepID=A0A1G5L4C2_9FIRM|nr:extracellular solute-binding protein [Alkaliphilus peptidifermentans]SCZ07636.1 iron(III) transport system substrate-binding protein [Alkaliphilus peptidifermentans DSM 18978]
MKKVISVVIMLVVLLTASACGQKEGSDKLIIYSNSLTDGRGEWVEEKAKEAGFNVTTVQVGGGDLANRLIAEKNNPVADIVFGLNTMGFETLKKGNILAKHVPVWADNIEEGMNDNDGYYHSLVKQAILLIYSQDLYSEETGPQDWPDLWENPDFHGKYFLFPSLSGGTTRAVISGILVRYLDENGELGVSDEGWEAIKQLYDNGYIAKDGEEFYALLAGGKTPMGQMWSSGLAAREEQYGVKSYYAKPKIGVPYVVEQIGIVEGSSNLEESKRFLDWFGSAEIQGQWADKFYSLPANKEALSSAPEYIRSIDESLSVQEIDWGFVGDHIDQWAEKIELEIMK